MPTNRRAPVRPLVASLAATLLPLLSSSPASASVHQTDPATDPAPADLEVIYGITSVGHIHPGDHYEFQLGVHNRGPGDAHAVQVVVDVPTVLQVPAPPPPCTFAEAILSCSFPHLPSGEVVQLLGRASLDPAYVGDGSDIVRTVTVSSETADADDTNNSVTVAGPKVEGVRAPAAAAHCSPTSPAPPTDGAPAVASAGRLA
jgi:hypothetical protein